MIAEFSSLIELSAALYLTISLDDLLLKRFWTPDYGAQVQNEFKKIQMPNIAKRATIDNANNLSTIEDNRSRKRGGLLFSLTVILLIISGFEEQIRGDVDAISASVEGTMICMFLLVYAFDNLFIRNWWHVLLFALFIPGSCLIIGQGVIALSPGFIASLESTEFDEKALRTVMLIALLAPVLWQLLRNWVYSKYYLQYIIGETKKKAGDYDAAIKCDGHNLTDIAPQYLNVVGDTFAAGDRDRPITPFLNVLQDELSGIEYVPSIIPLIRYSFNLYKKPRLPKRKFEQYYVEYSQMQHPPKLEVFCRQRGIDYKSFRVLFKKRRYGKGK